MITTTSKIRLRRSFLFNISLLVLSLSIFSCSRGLEEKVVGTWKGSDFLFKKTDGPDLVVTINGGIDRHLNSKLILKEDKTYEKLVGEYDNGKGTWVLEDDRLIMTSENGNELVYMLLKVTDKELITRHEVAEDTPKGQLVGTITLSYSR